MDFFNSLEKNTPVSITEVVDNTELSWTYVKRILKQKLKNNYAGFHFEKSGNTWIAWKDRDKIIRKLEHTCGEMLESEKSSRKKTDKNNPED